jgi:ankyrin repeat protein
MAKKDFNKVNKINFNGTNPFFEAIERMDTDLVRDMIDHGADVHGRTTGRNLFSTLMVEVPYAERSTPLHVACLFGSGEITNLLLAHEADANAKNDDGMTPLDYALSGHAYYQASLDKKKASRFSSPSSIEKVEEKLQGFEEVIRDVLAHGGKPGLFDVPEKFMGPAKQDKPPSRQTPFLP